MPVDIEHLTYEELVALNHRIVERLKFLDRFQAHRAMMAFDVGARVSFESTREGRLTGTLVKFNRKNVTVLTDDNRQWRVPPEMLSPIRDVPPGGTVVPRQGNGSR
ncbi:MAG: hypothetical protein FKY71_14355 [Spiribacter salinus]|uniref:Uncharacterized protein n=1 Tax=Spiribacter salinus TaxID=1335746 RepID=A0A540VNL8_9GAMM|nr:MAG: hypothetical protein FKY71_14355 [Spiribacter salinus]